MDLMMLGIMMAAIASAFAALGYKGRVQVVGIDLGTTFSVVAVKSGDLIEVVPDYITGKSLLPSVVAYRPDGSVVVGTDAVALRASHPQNTIFNAKRFIGRSLLEVQDDAKAHPFRIAANRTGSEGSVFEGDAAAGFSVPMADEQIRWISPVQVGTELVRRMKESVARHMGYGIHRAVICIPAKFGAREARATQEAFEAAGIKVARVVEEPTAAAVAYNLHEGTGVRHVLVYDIGGGTLDTSLLYMNDRSISVMGVAGDEHLGGSDFDARTRDLLVRKVEDAERIDASQAPDYRCSSSDLLFLAEQAKITLSGATRAEVRCLHDDGSARRLVITREEFEEESDDLFTRALAPVYRVLEDQMMTADGIHDLVLVGGASRTPKLRAKLQELMGPDKTLHTEIDPDITVAYGAANVLD